MAALLMSGATATFTSCIDTDEPAGIEELRGAKAALLQAKADYQAALTAYRQVQVQQAQVDLELKNVVLQIEQLKVAKAQAQNEKDLADLQYQIEELAEEHKAEMARLQAETATKQESLEQALADLEITLLTYREDKYQAEIRAAIGQVQTLRTALNTAEATLKGYQANLLDAQAQLGESYRNSLVADSLALEKGLENQKFSLEQIQALADVDHADAAEQVTAINNQIAEIEAQALEITQQIATLQEEINPITNEIATIETEYAVADKIVQIPVANVPAAIQEDLIDVLGSTSVTGVSPTVNWDEIAAATFANEDGTEMIADYVTNGASLHDAFGGLADLDAVIDNLSDAIEQEYATAFWNAYNTEFGTSYSYPTNEITPEVIAAAKVRLAEMSQDATAAYAIFKADSTAWETAYDAYVAAAKAYGYETSTQYADAQEKLEAYWNEADATKKAAALKAARAQLSAYYAVRVPLDNPTLPEVTPTGATAAVALNVALANSTTYTDAMLGSLLDTYNVGTITALLGSDIDLSDKTATYYLGAAEDDGALQAYLRASGKVWGTTYTLASARVTPATEDEYEAGTVTGGTFGTYMGYAAGIESFSNIESWMAITELLVEQSDKYQAAIDDIEVRVNEKQVAIAEQQDAIYKLEFDRNVLDGTALSFGNPYTTAASSVVNKKSSLVTLRGSITGSMTGSTYTIYYYDFNETTGTGNWDTMTDTKENLIATLEQAISDTEQALDEAKADIEKFDQGLDDGSYGTLVSTIEAQIAAQEQAVEEAKANLERAEGMLNNLLEAYAASSEEPAA